MGSRRSLSLRNRQPAHAAVAIFDQQSVAWEQQPRFTPSRAISPPFTPLARLGGTSRSWMVSFLTLSALRGLPVVALFLVMAFPVERWRHRSFQWANYGPGNRQVNCHHRRPGISEAGSHVTLDRARADRARAESRACSIGSFRLFYKLVTSEGRGMRMPWQEREARRRRPSRR